MHWRRLLTEPLLHFFVLGALLFQLYAWVGPDQGDAPDEILVDAPRLEALEASFESTWQRQPNANERQALINAWVREEILYREGLANQLDVDDPVIRRRIAQKMQFLAEAQLPPPPTDPQLQAWLDQHAERYQREPRYSLRQVYFSAQTPAAEIASALHALTQQTVRPDQLGSATQLPAQLNDSPAGEVSRLFGQAFSQALENLPEQQWLGPLRSGYGQHLVWLEQRQASALPPFAELRDQLLQDFANEQRQAASERQYQVLRQRYQVRVEIPALAQPALTVRP